MNCIVALNCNVITIHYLYYYSITTKLRVNACTQVIFLAALCKFSMFMAFYYVPDPDPLVVISNINSLRHGPLTSISGLPISGSFCGLAHLGFLFFFCQRQKKHITTNVQITKIGPAISTAISKTPYSFGGSTQVEQS